MVVCGSSSNHAYERAHNSWVRVHSPFAPGTTAHTTGEDADADEEEAGSLITTEATRDWSSDDWVKNLARLAEIGKELVARLFLFSFIFSSAHQQCSLEACYSVRSRHATVFARTISYHCLQHASSSQLMAPFSLSLSL